MTDTPETDASEASEPEAVPAVQPEPAPDAVEEREGVRTVTEWWERTVVSTTT